MRQQWIYGGLISLLAAFIISGVLGCGSEGGDAPPASIQAGSTDDSAALDPVGAGTRSEDFAPSSVDSPVMLMPEGPISAPPVKKDYQLQPVSPEVVIKTNLGDIRVRLNYEKAPRTVGNFLGNYVDKKFYEGTVFHYVDRGFIAIAGGFDAEYTAKETEAYVVCESNNGLKNHRGTVAMTRLPEYADSATSQFFFNLADNTSLDFQSYDSPAAMGYCVFGEVIEGMDVVDRIAAVDVSDRPDFPKCPAEPVVIQSVERVN